MRILRSLENNFASYFSKQVFLVKISCPFDRKATSHRRMSEFTSIEIIWTRLRVER